MKKEDAMFYATTGCLIGGLFILAYFHIIVGACVAGIGFWLLRQLLRMPHDQTFLRCRNCGAFEEFGNPDQAIKEGWGKDADAQVWLCNKCKGGKWRGS